MLFLILTLISGIVLGRIFRTKSLILKSNKLITPIVLLLLFFMGISIGNNKEIMANFPALGFQALIITFGALAGTIISAFLLEKLIMKKEFSKIKKEKSNIL